MRALLRRYALWPVLLIPTSQTVFNHSLYTFGVSALQCAEHALGMVTLCTYQALYALRATSSTRAVRVIMVYHQGLILGARYGTADYTCPILQFS